MVPLRYILAVFLAGVAAAGNALAAEEPHPLQTLLDDASRRLEKLHKEVKDYRCILVKRERIQGKLMPSQRMHVKVRHELAEDGEVVTPFSVYLRFFGRRDLEGREVLYVKGQNNNKMLVRKGGRLLANMTLKLSPQSPLAMSGNRFAVTEIGIENLLRRLVALGKIETRYAECEVTEIQDIAVAGRPCTGIQIRHPVRRQHFRYHVARIYIDRELQLPICFQSYDWPKEEGQVPPLIEEYTYVDLRINVGLDDADFDPSNDEYHFSQRDEPATIQAGTTSHTVAP
jgi:hypothetical protein